MATFAAGQRLTAQLLNAAFTEAVTDVQATSGTTTSTTYTATLTGGTACGVVFVAPTSGKVNVHNSAFIDNSTTPRSLVTFRIRTGSSIGSGSDVVAALDVNAIGAVNVDDTTYGKTVTVTGLTPGATYNCQQLFKVSSASMGTFQQKQLSVTPLAA